MASSKEESIDSANFGVVLFYETATATPTFGNRQPDQSAAINIEARPSISQTLRRLAVLSNKVFLIKVCTLLLDIMLLHYSVNISFISTGKPKNVCDSLYCRDLEPNVRYL
jgi:hypothetical protein